ncbi:MAG TPA: FAD-dependent oxidoreductase [Hyphomicrobiaceae bacterium]|nr:FAD-dependent oxidoreductase [Hyphomicrobiaceae bacterium]
MTVVGAGVLGLWQALTLARAGHRVRLVERSADPFARNASSHAGAMLAPDCEAESAPGLIRDLGREGLALWRGTYPRLVNAGSLVVAAARDRADLARFARLTSRHRSLGADEIGKLEPDLAGRFGEALYFPDEAHMAAPDALAFLLEAARAAGADVRLGTSWEGGSGAAMVIDCTGLEARAELPSLRGVRGERLLLGSREVKLGRPVRLLHPRHPLYVVPWGEGRYLVGATMIESEDEGPVTVRSALELLGTAYALAPAFGEAEILETGSGVRPAFPDNVPRAVVRDGGRRILVNGAFRHGFLLAPVLAKAVADFLATGAADHPLIVVE